MYKVALVFFFIFATHAVAQAPSSSDQPQCTRESDTCSLNLVIQQVVAALDKYQTSTGAGADALPPLMSAEFDFKTTAAVTVGGTVNLLIFKFGVSHEKDTVHDVTFTYQVPQVPAGAALSSKKPSTSLTEELASTIQSAAMSVKNAPSSIGKAKFQQLAVTVQFGVKWDGSGGISAPISFVTAGINADKNKNTVQSVKLIFSNSPKKN